MHLTPIRLLCTALAAALLSACSATEPPRDGNYSGLAAIGNAATPSAPSPSGPNDDACDVAQPTGICWYPATAKFHPDGERLIINLCSNRRGATYYCRMVEYQVKTQGWSLVPGQEAGKSYLYPAYSNDGRSLVFVVDDCAQPWCLGGIGMGQLTTQPVQAQPGQAARYGAMRELNVYGATRPNFTPDDQSLVYWRWHHKARLASGRTVGNVSIYRYTPQTDTEAHFIPSLYSDQVAAYFTVPMSAPHFSRDGKILRFVSRHDSSLGRGSSSLDQGDPDVEVRLGDGVYEGRRTADVTEGLGRVFAEHPRLGYLAGPANLRLVDAKTLATTAVLLDPGYSWVADASINAAGSLVVAVSGVQSKTDGTQGIRRDHWLYLDAPRNQVRSAPVLALISLANRDVSALEWPNVETLTP